MFYLDNASHLVTAKCNISIWGKNMTTNDLHTSTSFKRLNFFSDKINWSDITTYFRSIAWQNVLDNKPLDAMYHTILDTCLKICIDNLPKRKLWKKSKMPRDRKTNEKEV